MIMTDKHIYKIEKDLLYGRPGPLIVPWKLGNLFSDGIGVIVSLTELPHKD